MMQGKGGSERQREERVDAGNRGKEMQRRRGGGRGEGRGEAEGVRVRQGGRKRVRQWKKGKAKRGEGA